ncbi:MAG: hypothetical protein ABI729_08585 [Chitinophagales bacterium]
MKISACFDPDKKSGTKPGFSRTSLRSGSPTIVGGTDSIILPIPHARAVFRLSYKKRKIEHFSI